MHKLSIVRVLWENKTCHDIIICSACDLSVTFKNVDPRSPFPDEGCVPDDCDVRVVGQVMQS